MLHHQADLTRAPSALGDDVAAVLSERDRRAWRVTGYEVLTARVSVVARVEAMREDGLRGSVIAKHVPAAVYGVEQRAGWRHEFLEEAAAYRFLSTLAARFAEHPTLLGVHENGAIVLEDLGAQAEPQVAMRVVGRRLAITLARLHAASMGQRAALEQERTRSGLSPTEHDLRHDGILATARRRDAGVDLLASWAQSLGIAPARELRRLISPAIVSTETPSPWHALIHDDVINQRQCVTRAGRLLLLDFENARYAHCLRDVAKLLVGKFERDLDHGDMFLNRPGFGLAFAADYRRALLRAGGPAVSDEEFSRLLAAALVHATLIQLGAMAELLARTEVRGGLLANLACLLDGLERLLAPLGAMVELREPLARLRDRVAVGQALVA